MIDQGCSLGLDVSVSRRSRDLFSKVSVSSRSRKILKGLGLGLGLEKKTNVSVSSRSRSLRSRLQVTFYIILDTLLWNTIIKIKLFHTSVRFDTVSTHLSLLTY